MKLRVHIPVPQELISREERLRNKVPMTGALLDTIRDKTERFKFGIPDNDIDQYYRFSDVSNTEVFFTERFKQFHDQSVEVDEDAIEIDVAKSVNSFDFTTTRNRPSENFRMLAVRFSDELNTARSNGAPYIAILRGPTGSGKTAYSKCLFSAGIRQFWDRGIIPSRVEFSKFFYPGKAVKTKALLSAVHQCQVRDLLIYLFFNKKGKVNDDILELIAPRRLSGRIRNELTTFNDITEQLVVDGRSFSLSEAHGLWKSHLNFFSQKVCARILELLKKPRFELQFLVSLDGFDALKTKDFLQSDSYHGPISAVADLLGESLNQAARYGETASSHNTNLMVYMRDTTYERIRLELHMGTSGQRDLPVRWIVPPSYKILVNTVAASIDKDVSELATAAKVAPFTTNIRRNMVRVLNDEAIGLSIDQPLSSAFSWNARHMKRHIRRVCIWSLENYVHNNEAEVTKRQGETGLSVSWLWDKATRNPSLRSINDYSVLEAFFLDDTRCLQSKLRLTSRTVQNHLNKNNLENALNHLRERPELDGLFDSILNYMTKGAENEGGQCFPHTLVMVRILQLLSERSGQTMEDLLDGLTRLYPSLSRTELQFYLICLCENEYLIFHGTENSSSIDQCEFFLSNFGSILLNKVLFSATYFSQSIMLAELTRFGLGRELKRLDFRSSEHWLSHCVYNAIIGYNIVLKTETAEFARFDDDGAKAELRLSARLRNSLTNELDRVFASVVRSRSTTINRYYSSLPSWLEEAKKRFPELDVLEEVWED